MCGPCCEGEGVHVTMMYDSRLLLPFMRSDLLRPRGETVEMSVILWVERKERAGI